MNDLRCSVVTAELGERAAGSAGTAHRFLLVELPYPWPNKIDAHHLLANLDPAAADRDPDGASTRLLGINDGSRFLTAGDDTSSGHRVICYSRAVDSGSQGFDGFTRAEATIGRRDLVATIDAITAGDLSSLTPVDGGDEVGGNGAIKDLLLCTHGSRDRCCGSLGTILHVEVEFLVADKPDLRLWRTSHTGGHRFAPTGITFPDGMTWAYLDGDTVAGIIDRSVEPSTIGPNVRGCIGLDSPPAQIADSIGFHQYGWDWVDATRTVSLTHTDLAGSNSVITVTVEAMLPRGAVTIEVDLVQGEPVPVPVCGAPLEESIKSTKSYDIIEIR